ncbi:MAG: hypothetical protein RBG13Loki_0646 [Promethearchaeota archaeon CR_4]|nr:MAG: hypothetical protein RBG13Loki_0646 [Candidatus Lokiarchaeota archaeon CR_4]
MMFFVRAPPSDKIGPYEKEYRPLTLVQKGIGLVQRSVAEGENKDADPNGLYFYMYASCLGAAKFEADLKLHFRITNSTSNETNLPSVDEFREFFLKEYRNRLEKAYV